MARSCTICIHADKFSIDAALVGGQALRAIADQFSVSKTVLGRHKDNHLPATLTLAKKEEEVIHGADLLHAAQALLAKTSSLLAEAEQAGDRRMALAGVKEARGRLELLSKLQQAHRPEDGTYARSMQILGEELDVLNARDEALADSIGKGMVDALVKGLGQLEDWEILRPRIIRRLEAAETP